MSAAYISWASFIFDIILINLSLCLIYCFQTIVFRHVSVTFTFLQHHCFSSMSCNVHVVQHRSFSQSLSLFRIILSTEHNIIHHFVRAIYMPALPFRDLSLSLSLCTCVCVCVLSQRLHFRPLVISFSIFHSESLFFVYAYILRDISVCLSLFLVLLCLSRRVTFRSSHGKASSIRLPKNLARRRQWLAETVTPSKISPGPPSVSVEGLFPWPPVTWWRNRFPMITPREFLYCTVFA